MRRVLVTGASGLLGRQLIPLLLEAGVEVHGVSRHGGGVDDRVRWHEVDLLAPGAAGGLAGQVGADGLIHLAWEARPGTTGSEVHRHWLAASRDLLSAFCEAGGERLLVAGTCFEYDWSDGLCVEETTPLAPATEYGRCKRELCRFLADRPWRPGQSWVWPRVFFVYGPHEHPQRLVASVVRSLLAGEPAECTHGRQVRDYLHARDVAEGLWALFQSEGTGPVNLASGEAAAVGTLAEKAAALLGRSELLRMGARPAPELEPPVILGDRSRQEGLVSWRPRISLDEGLADTIAYWKREVAVS